MGSFFFSKILRAALVAGVLPASAPLRTTAAPAMLDTRCDRPGEPWCYAAKSTTVIGLPDRPEVTQVTYDGALFTVDAELCFFSGDRDTPVMARGKRFSEDRIPVVSYGWKDGPVAYDIECFSGALEGVKRDDPVNFVRIRMTNTGVVPVRGSFGAATRRTGRDNRFDYRRASFDPTAVRAMKPVGNDGGAWRGDALVYTFTTAGATTESVPGKPYEKPFRADEAGIRPETACLVARYARDLAPGESFEAVLKMPRVPVPAADTALLQKLADARYDDFRAKTVAFWNGSGRGSARFEIPEPRVQAALDSSLTHVLLATRKSGSGWMQTDGLPYQNFFLTSVPQMTLAYLDSGMTDRAESVVLRAIGYQEKDGLYFDRVLAHGVKIPAGHGHILYSAAITALYSRDRDFGEKVFPSLSRGVAYLAAAMDRDDYGLLPPAYPYDNEMILGHYTSNNLWALTGLRNTVRLARFLGHDNEAAEWEKIAGRLERNILKGIAASAKPDGYVPTGLYGFKTGPEARKGFAEYQTDCDWENMLLAFPGELLAPGDPRVRGTVDHVRKNYAEGVMTYRHGKHLHQYITANQTEQYLAMGDGYTALKDFYHILVHGGPTGEGFENLVEPWTDRVVDPHCPTPHAWASAKIMCLVRDLLLLEYGGRCGMDAGKRELWLFHCLSPAWVVPGRRVAFAGAPTEFGVVSGTMDFTATGANVTLKTDFREMPARLRIRAPYFKKIVSFTTDAKESRIDGDCLLLSPDATRVAIGWTDLPVTNPATDILSDYRSANTFDGVDKTGRAIVTPHTAFLTDGERALPAEPLSFDLVLATFRHEYARRVAAHVAAGGKLLRVSAPPLAPDR